MNREFLGAENVYLRPLCEEDIGPRYLGWLNDDEVCRYNSHAIFPNTDSRMREYVKWAQETRDAVVLAIVSRADDLHIGNIALLDIDWIARSANFAILVGERDYWKRGVGAEAGLVLVRYAFERLNLNRVYCGTSADNMGMQRLAVRLGMQQEGVRREAIYKHGRYVDLVEFGVLRQEFEKLSQDLAR
ncbi:MAG TPA: GNAT family protein [Burkholderiales bacterium]|nr:GNAT family protein [Burkholderiales bacterium]